MDTVYKSFSDLIPGISGAALFWILIVIVLGIIGFLIFRRRDTRTDATVKGVARVLRKLSNDVVSNVMLRDAIEGDIHIEHLCLTPGGIVVVDIKDYKGYLFGGNNTDQWTQVIDNRSYRFENPLYRNKDKVRALESILDEVPVVGCVVFTDAGAFPKDKPDGVFQQENLSEVLSAGEKPATLSSRFLEEWEKLKHQLESPSGIKN